MKIEQVALITYTIREHIKTPSDFRKSMRKLADIGYRAVQISGMQHDVMPAAEIAEVCREHGLTICATHEPGATILNDPESVVERLRTLGCQYTAYPCPPAAEVADPEKLQSLITKLDHAGAVLRKAGQVLTYHNHALEFVKTGGRTALEQIYEGTNAQNLQGEIDTYWVQLGGGNPEAWCRRLKGRLPLLHLKDVGIREANIPTMFEIGHGNLDFKPIVAAAEESGCEWFIVEQDTCPGDPFDSLKLSFDYIAGNLIN